MIVADNEYVTLRYIPEHSMLHHTVHQPVDETVFMASLDKGVDLMSKHHIEKWLSDDRLNGPFSEAFSAWAMTNWIPRAVSAGWKYWANVVPLEAAAAGTLNPFIEALHGMGLRLMVFSSLEDAENWLSQL